jgi:hypothetical protein
MVLSDEDRSDFIRDGFFPLRQVFSAEQGAKAQAVVFERLHEAGYDLSDLESWPSSFTLEEYIDDDPVLTCFTDYLADAICEIVGEDNWNGVRRWGLWSVNVGDESPGPDLIPSWGWHADGNWYRHTLTSHEQGLVLFGLFTDVSNRDGPTVVAGGSHRRAARILSELDKGITHLDLFERVLKKPLGNFYNLTGRVGDVWIAHPLLFHTRGLRSRGRPRLVTNANAGLNAPMTLDKPRKDMTLLELSMVEAAASDEAVVENGRKCRFD